MNFRSQEKQLNIDAFRSSLSGLDKSNRRIKLGETLPWDEIEQQYNKRLNNDKRGVGNKPARIIIGALLIKHKINLSAEQTIFAIQENPYMQYFVDLSKFTDQPIFDSSLFATIRKRFSTTDFNDMSVSLLAPQVEYVKTTSQPSTEDQDSLNDSSTPAVEYAFTNNQGRCNKGALKIDAIYAEVEAHYSTDIDLLHNGCKIIKRYIDKLCERFSVVHPSTHHKPAHSAYLEVIKRKKKSKSLIDKGKTGLQTYLTRDICSLIDLIAVNNTHLFYSLERSERKIAGTIKMHRRQEQILKDGIHTCADRIISFVQSHICLIVRAKAESPMEFGAKTDESIVQGYSFVDHHCWDAYNKSSDLVLQILLYQQWFDFLPVRIYANKFYMNKANHKWMKGIGIQAMGKPLDRLPKEAQTQEYQSGVAKAMGELNEVEATFKTGKRIYRANNIRAKLPVQLLDRNVLLRQKHSGIAEGTSSHLNFRNQFIGKSG